MLETSRRTLISFAAAIALGIAGVPQANAQTCGAGIDLSFLGPFPSDVGGTPIVEVAVGDPLFTEQLVLSHDVDPPQVSVEYTLVRVRFDCADLEPDGECLDAQLDPTTAKNFMGLVSVTPGGGVIPECSLANVTPICRDNTGNPAGGVLPDGDCSDPSAVEVEFDFDTPLTLTSGETCTIQYDMQVLRDSGDGTPNRIEQSASSEGFCEALGIEGGENDSGVLQFVQETPPLDNYKCYKAKHPPGSGLFQPRFTLLEDQFGGRCSAGSENPDASCTSDEDCLGGTCEGLLNKVVEPFEFCNPVSKNGDGIEAADPLPHLMCYKLMHLDEIATGRVVTDSDQFGDETLRLSSPATLCLPTVKCCEANLGEECVDDPQLCPGLVPDVEGTTNHFQCYTASREDGTPPPAEFPAQCDGGDSPGAVCTDDSDCRSTDPAEPDGTCIPTPVELVDQFFPGICSDGSDNAGDPCLFNSDCPDTVDPIGEGVCLGAGTNSDLTSATLHCNPTEKQLADSQGNPTGPVTPIVDEEGHLKCYQIADEEPAGNLRELVIYNQFAPEGQRIEVGSNGVKLCETAAKRVDDPGRKNCGLLGIEGLALLGAMRLGSRWRRARRKAPRA
jgi:hypothetical protein